MLTFFTTPKPFQGHIDMIQRNALRSWQRIHPEAEVLLFGDDEGAEQVSRELGLRHIPVVQRNSRGTPYVPSLFDLAHELARYDLLCYLNCDIVLMDDFRRAVETIGRNSPRFLMAGRRWDVNIYEPINFNEPQWQAQIREFALRTNRQRPANWIDYFVFPKEFFYHRIPQLVVGRPGWDNWVLWYARSSGGQLIDASEVICAVHQNHDYLHHPGGEKGVLEGEDAQDNRKYLEGHKKFRTLENATHVLKSDGLHPNYRHWFVRAKLVALDTFSPVWFFFLNLTRPLRHRLGLRQKSGQISGNGSA